MPSDPYRAPPEPSYEDSEVPASVPLAILVILLGLLLTVFAPHHPSEASDPPLQGSTRVDSPRPGRGPPITRGGDRVVGRS